MANGNMYQVTPAGDMTQGLAGLSNVLANVGEQRQQRELAEQKAALQREQQAALQAAIQSRDPDQYAAAIAMYPDAAGPMMDAVGLREDYQKEDKKNFLMNVLSNPEQADQLYQERIQQLEAQGRDATHTRNSYELFRQDPEMAMRGNMMALADVSMDAYKALQESMAQPEVDTPTPYTDPAKIEADRRAGLLSDEQAESLLAQSSQEEAPETFEPVYDNAGNVIAQRNTVTGRIHTDPRAPDLRTDPTSGVLSRYNPTTQQQDIIQPNIPGPEETPQMPAHEFTEEDLAFDPAKGTGFWNALAGTYNNTLGQLPITPTFKGPEEAAQNIRMLERDAVMSLSASNRPPIIEQERIGQMLPSPMAWFENPEVARWQTSNFVNLMMNQYVDDLRYQQDLTNSRDLRESSRERANRIESIIRRVVDPEAAEMAFQSINRIEQEIGDLNNMSTEELLEMDPSQMTDAQLDVYLQRLEGQ